MKHRQFHRAIYQIRHRYLTLNNVVVIAALIIGAGLVWGSLGVMQRNYTLERTLEHKKQESRLVELQTKSLTLEQGYYKTREYQELAVRERLGKGLPGERVLILPKQSAKTPSTAAVSHSPAPAEMTTPSNFEQWMNFLFGTAS